MWRGGNKETLLEVKEAKQRDFAGLRRSRHIIFVELSLLRRIAYLEFKAGQIGHNGPARWTRLPQF